MRLIITSFLFLGWGFYELSGGKDFVPEQKPIAEVLEPAAVEAEAIEVAQTADASEVASQSTTNTLQIEPVAELEVTPASLVVVEQAPAPEPVEQDIQSAVANALDLRLVDKDRVNVRSGPGTNNAISARLVAGDEVQVIEDLGNGWVQVIMTDGSSGWMADFLLTAKTN